MMWPWKKNPQSAPESPVVRMWKFDPQPDITVLELAWLWGNMWHGGLREAFIPAREMPIWDDAIELVPANVMRHLKRVDDATTEGGDNAAHA